MRCRGLDAYFEISVRGSTLRTELLAGLSTFVALSYVVFVNPAILSEAGVPRGSAFVATVVTSGLATLLMGIWARLPFALAPGMEMNAYVAFFVVGTLGFTWQEALGAVFWSGAIFLAVSASGLRRRILDAIPDQMKTALALSVGVFVALVGLRIAGVLAFDGVTIAGYGSLFSAGGLALVLSLGLVWGLSRSGIPGAALVSVAVTTIVLVLFTHQPSPAAARVGGGVSEAFGALDLAVIRRPNVWSVVLTLLVIDFYGSVAKLIGLSAKTSLARPGGLPGLERALLVDSAATVGGAVLGTSNLTVYVESGVGIAAGGRTGVAAIVCAVCLLASLAVAPVLQLVPLSATSGILVYVAVQLCPRWSRLRELDRFELIGLLAMQVAVVLTFAIDRAFLVGVIVYSLRAAFNRGPINRYLVLSGAVLGFSWWLAR
jgi:AGZA family xanthine/uracil permease-like MFS transporter